MFLSGFNEDVDPCGITLGLPVSSARNNGAGTFEFGTRKCLVASRAKSKLLVEVRGRENFLRAVPNISDIRSEGIKSRNDAARINLLLSVRGKLSLPMNPEQWYGKAYLALDRNLACSKAWMTLEGLNLGAKDKWASV